MSACLYWQSFLQIFLEHTDQRPVRQESVTGVAVHALVNVFFLCRTLTSSPALAWALTGLVFSLRGLCAKSCELHFLLLVSCVAVLLNYSLVPLISKPL